MALKTFNRFCSTRKDKDTVSIVAEFLVQNNLDVYEFCEGYFCGKAEVEKDPELQEFFVETSLRYSRSYNEGLFDRMSSGYKGARDNEKGRNSGLGFGLGKALGWGAEKMGQAAGWLNKKGRAFAHDFGQGTTGMGWKSDDRTGAPQVAGSAASPNTGSGGGPDSIPMEPDPTQPAGTGSGESGQPAGDGSGSGDINPQAVQQVGGVLDQAIEMMKNHGMDATFIDALTHLRSSIEQGQYQNPQPAAAAKAGNSLPPIDQQDVYQRRDSLQGDVQKIEQELAQARAANDSGAVAQLTARLAQARKSVSQAKGRVTKHERQ